MEVAAHRHVEAWVGEAGVVTDTGEGHDPDFWIEYADGRTGWGEVGWHEDPEVRSISVALTRQEPIPLDAGLGQWAVHLRGRAPLRKLQREVPRLVRRLASIGRDQLATYDDVTPPDLERIAADLAIEDVHLMTPGGPDQAILLSPGTSGPVSSDPDTIVSWIEAMLADPNYEDTTKKLLVRAADERHVFLFLGSRTPIGVTVLMARPLSDLPTRPPRLPDGITHVWALAPYGSGDLLLWDSQAGWSATSVVEPTA